MKIVIIKNILIGLVSLSFILPSTSEAGIISKTVKGVVAYQAGKAAVKHVVKKQATKIAEKAAKKEAKKKLAQKELLDGELKVGRYEDLIDAKKTTKKLADQKPTGDASTRTQSHHMPSDAFMKKHDISKEDGIAVEMQEARHALTRTYKGRNREHLNGNETPREALARDIKDARQIYQDNGHYNKNVRESLQEVVKKNKEKFPDLYKKQ